MRTIEEQGREYAEEKVLQRSAKCISDKEFNGCDIGLAYMDGLKAATGWIAVANKAFSMPDDDGCLLLDDTGKVWKKEDFVAQQPLVTITHFFLYPPIPQE